MEDVRNFYKGKIILVTGGVGSIGGEIVRTLLKCSPKTVRILDNNETGLFDLQQELKSDRIRAFIGDVRDKERLKRAISGVDIVFHAAALKHVLLCEYNPFEAVKTNVYGTQNLLDAALDENVEKFITISTDKAVNPISVMGASKLLAERLTTATNNAKGSRKTAFSAVRFGNVLNSRGSLLTIIKNQFEKGGPVTLTDERMTRFIMSIQDAVMLVLKAGMLAEGGEIFILKMPSIKVRDLIESAIEELALKNKFPADEIKIDVIGKRYGEKMYEELMTPSEMTNMKELKDMCVLYAEKVCDECRRPEDVKQFNSNDADHISKDEIKRMLRKIEWIE